MSHEPFVMSSVDRAQEWVGACSKSCAIPPEQSAAMLASLCGFGSWDVMIFGIHSLRPSACDEVVGKEMFDLRVLHYASVLLREYEFHPAVVQAVITHMSPSSSKQFVGFDLADVDHTAFDGAPEPAIFDIDEFFATDICERRFEAMRPHFGHVDCSGWMGALDALDWHVEFSDTEGLLGEPALEIYSSSPEAPMVPVYLTQSLPEPEFTGLENEHPVMRLLQFACLGNFITQFAPYGASDFLILGNRPQVTTLNGKWYCHIGVAYNSGSGKWTDLLINSQCRDIDTLLRLNRSITSLQGGESTLSEVDLGFASRLVRTLAGFVPGEDIAEEWPVVGMPTSEAWSVIGAVPPGEYHTLELSPHVFNESSAPGEGPAA